ncbi:MAG: ketoacyl-ACP synthase III [Armatimonadetes bacterium]|nr:ketoacyl-ACP synthase III [Armatimonadota bacterium]
MSVPDQVLSNYDLEKRGDTSDEWIRTRTGIQERRIAGESTTTSTLGTQAALNALRDAGISPQAVDVIVCATTSGDYVWPSTACLIQQGIGASHICAFDVAAACSGFVYALDLGAQYIESGRAETVLVVGADTLTKQLNWEDRSTCVLFGDGAAAVMLRPCNPDEGLLATSLGADGGGAELIWVPAGGTKTPISQCVLDKKLNTIQMRGPEVYKFAVKVMGEVAIDALSRCGLTGADVDLLVPHQANIRIIQSAAERMGLCPDRVFVNVERYGNTSAASVPIALSEAVEAGRIQRGDIVVLVGFGAGLTWGANVIRWNRDESGHTKAESTTKDLE